MQTRSVRRAAEKDPCQEILPPGVPESQPASVEVVEALRVQPADLLAGLVADIRSGSQMLGALRPFAVPMGVIACEHDEVGAQHIDHAGQDRFLWLARPPDAARGEIFGRTAAPAALDPTSSLLVMLVQAVDEERDPARARLEEGDPQLWMALEDAAREYTRQR